MRATLAMLAAGWVYGLAFPPTDVRGVAWIALVPLIVAARRRSVRTAALLGAPYAIAATYATVDWLPRAVSVFYAQPFVVGFGLFTGITLLMVVPPFMVFAAAVRYTASAPAALRPVVVAATWTTVELWRANAFGGNPWVLLGYSQTHVPLVAQIADVAGVYGIGFVIAAVNAALAELVLAVRSHVPRRDVAVAMPTAALLLLATLAYGARARTRVFDDSAAATPVAVVQGNLDLGSQWQQEFYGRNLDAYLRLTARALRERPARIVVWPEAAMTFFVDRESLYRAIISQVLSSFGAELVAGGPYAPPGSDTTFYNSAFLLEPSGTIRGRYDKEQLLPFAEYFPFPSLDVLRRSFGRIRTFVPGAVAPDPLSTVANRAGILICNEAMFPELARSRVRSGATLLLVLTNDTWVGDVKFARIASDMAIMRAIETRRWVVRASTAGPSAIVDPHGTVRASAEFGTAATVVGDVAPSTTVTPYARYGDVFAAGCVAIAALAVVAAFRRRDRYPGAA